MSKKVKIVESLNFGIKSLNFDARKSEPFCKIENGEEVWYLEVPATIIERINKPVDKKVFSMFGAKKGSIGSVWGNLSL